MEWTEVFRSPVLVTWMVLVYGWLLSTSTESTTSHNDPGCAFPMTLRTTEWPWKILSTDSTEGILHQYRRVTFRDHDMRMDYMRRPYSEEIATSYTYTCLEKLSSNRYLVAREDDSIIPKYTCIQFLRRGTNAYQLRLGPLKEKRSHSLCSSSRLELMDAPLVYYHTVGGYWDEQRNANDSYIVCPLQGGYLVKWYDEEKRPGCNSTIIEPLKLENECTPMEGLRLFSFNHHTCALPDSRLERAHYCFSTWTHKQYTFMLLWQRQGDFDMPCVRMETSSRGSDHQVVYFFMDGVCDSSTSISRSTSYRKLELEKLVVPDICSNENSVCTDHLAMPSCTAESAAVCRSYCKVCQSPLPWNNQTFPGKLQGKWQEITFEKKYEIVEFKQGLLRYGSRGGDYSLTSTAVCRRGGAMASKATEYSLLSTYDNGCSPRVTSAIIASRSNSVLSIHFSPAMIAKVQTELDMQHNHWRLTNDYKWWCADIGLEVESNPRSSTYRYWYDVWTNLLRVESVHVTVPCDFSLPTNPHQFSLRTGHNDLCMGQLHPAEGDRFNMDILGSCTKSDTTLYARDIVVDTTVSLQATIRHFCLASFEDNYKNKFIITKSPDVMLQVNITYLCWFISNTGRVVYWLPIGSCDTATELLIMKRKVTPLATLYLDSAATSMRAGHWWCSCASLLWLAALWWTLGDVMPFRAVF